MRKTSTNIHSLMIVRNDMVILDAYFYPYDGSTVHELASVTKSVLTTVDEIANREAYALKMAFKGDQVTVRAQERTHVASLALTGKRQSP